MCSTEIDPEHILLGFLKLSEVDLDDIYPGRKHKLREVEVVEAVIPAKREA